jgi:trans-2,3-dihydro-3-hydroxyanthranilate isomerase
MQKYHYHLVDVFTDQPFGGNQLAVFLNGHHLTPEQMQRITRELNLAETTFVLPAQDQVNDFWVRIFAPATEMKMAGHPTVGTAFVLAKEGFVDQEMVRFEEGVGVIPVMLEYAEGTPSLITMQQPSPIFGTVFEDRPFFAEMLSLNLDDLMADYPIQLGWTGVPFTYVPIKSLDAMKRIRLRLDHLEKHYQDADTKGIFALTPETERSTSTVHCRMFAPLLGIPEDPATGSGSGFLGVYLVKYGLAKAGRLISEQGFEMGRPSLIHITIERSGEDFTRILVGGQCVAMGEGFIYEDIFD